LRHRHAGVPDRIWDDVVARFDETVIVALLMAVATINVWNRLGVTTHQSLPDRAGLSLRNPIVSASQVICAEG
jgi:hypothetical protein